MTIMLALAASLIAAPFPATPTEALDPDRIDLADAIQCRIGAPSYNSFAMSLAEEPGIAGKRHWKTVASGSPFMTEYELPAPITVAGHYGTRRIAFTSTAILAILDVEDPAVIAREEKIDNAANLNPIVAAIIASDETTRGQGKGGT